VKMFKENRRVDLYLKVPPSTPHVIFKNNLQKSPSKITFKNVSFEQTSKDIICPNRKWKSPKSTPS
jgi:hypothetical protein